MTMLALTDSEILAITGVPHCGMFSSGYKQTKQLKITGWFRQIFKNKTHSIRKKCVIKTSVCLYLVNCFLLKSIFLSPRNHWLAANISPINRSLWDTGYTVFPLRMHPQIHVNQILTEFSVLFLIWKKTFYLIQQIRIWNVQSTAIQQRAIVQSLWNVGCWIF